MKKYYSKNSKFYVAIDCIIFGFDKNLLNVLLMKRQVTPMKGAWSLMGGFINEGESLDEAAGRILYSCTGLRDLYLEQLYTYGEVNRDPAARVLSVSYYALIKTEDYHEELGLTYGSKWFEFSKKPTLIFDHDIMLDKALRRLRRRSRSEPIGFELLPEKFTIPQLQKLYEAIHQVQMDKRNFRKRILAMHFLEKLNEKEKGASRKGAFLYRFDIDKYEEAINSGFLFEI
jgi:8-oxo-dGTP diphosphatase